LKNIIFPKLPEFGPNCDLGFHMGALDAVPDLPLGLQKNGEVMDYGGTIKPSILARSNIILYTAGF
jgi:hypothetical protein